MHATDRIDLCFNPCPEKLTARPMREEKPADVLETVLV